MMLEPSDKLVYLYYKCPKCKMKGDEIRLSEARSPGARHTCMFCGHVALIRTIEQVEVKYSRNDTKTSTVNVDTIKDRFSIKVMKSLKKMGYSDKEAVDAIKSALAKHQIKTAQELFKWAVLEHEQS